MRPRTFLFGVDPSRFLFTTFALGCFLLSRVGAASPDETLTSRPNIVIIYCDDLGYGDIGPFGSTRNRTPNLDRMAREGLRLTSFYSTSGVCTPSRASLLTGCYPIRVGMDRDSLERCVLFPAGKKGLHPDEVTIAEALRDAGYATACIGKWHLGDQPEFLPTRQGFDTYFGIPYANNFGPGPDGDPPLPLVRGDRVIEAPVDQDTITQRYTREALRFIRRNRSRPFFLYLAHTMPHVPVHVHGGFRGRSKNGIYGDAIEELDASTGRILEAIRELDIAERTLVIFTSDNGATSGNARSNAPLRGKKGTTWEGGMRVPCIAWWPGRIPAGAESAEMTATLDVLPTVARLTGAELAKGRKIDGKDVTPILLAEDGARSPHEAFWYYQMDQLQAVRSGKYKLHLPLAEKKKNWGDPDVDTPLLLFDLEADIGEEHDVAKDHPDVVEHLLALAERARAELGDVGRVGEGCRPAGRVENPAPLVLDLEASIARPEKGGLEDVSREVLVQREITYAETEIPRQRLDLYLPSRRAAEGPLPLVVFVHGGAWLSGDKRAGRAYVEPFVRTGRYAGASIGYRLTDEATWPAQIHDVKAGIRWLRAEARKYGVDPERIGVIGTSAGGHLVALLGTTGDVPALEGEVGSAKGISSRVACVADFFGPSELLAMSSKPSEIDHDAKDSPESLLVGGPLQERRERAREASPVTWASEGDAPMLIIHGTADPLVPFDQSMRLRKALDAAHVECRLIPVEGGGHGGFDDPAIDEAVRAFIERHLGRDPSESRQSEEAE